MLGLKQSVSKFYDIIIFGDSDLYDITNSIIEIPVVRVQLLLMMM